MMFSLGDLLMKCRRDGHLVDLPPQGKSGIEFKYLIENDILYIFIYGTDSFFDWVFHFLVGWGVMSEIFYASLLSKKIVSILEHSGVTINKIIIMGHSLGGSIASLAKEELIFLLAKQSKKGIYITSIGLGSKKPPYGILDILYVNKGDIVPSLTPWRNGSYLKKFSLGKWRPFWIAHDLNMYEKNLKDIPVEYI